MQEIKGLSHIFINQLHQILTQINIEQYFFSGVGPKEHLEELGIPVLKDLPVGQKLYDHLTFVGLIFTLNESIVARQEELTEVPVILDFLKGNGPLTGLGGVESFTYIKTKESLSKKKNHPDVELIFVGGSFSTDQGIIHRKTFKITDEIYDAIWRPLEGKPAVMVMPMLLQPKSFGYIKLRSKSPFDVPKFYGNFFTDPEGSDIKAFIAAVREAQRIATKPSMQRYGATLLSVPIPGCQDFIFDTDDYWECAIRHVCPTLHHQIATCKMGPNHDPEAVVDSNLRVYGVKNLRVADSSIIPIPLNAHTNGPAIMIGEKASDLIKQDWENYVDGRNIDIREIYPQIEYENYLV